MQKLIVTILFLCAICFSGCPDYSHLRPEPDYENMTDSGYDESGDDEPGDGESGENEVE